MCLLHVLSLNSRYIYSILDTTGHASGQAHSNDCSKHPLRSPLADYESSSSDDEDAVNKVCVCVCLYVCVSVCIC